MSKFQKHSHSSKWTEVAYPSQSFAMTLADMDLPIHPPFKTALKRKVEQLNNFTYKARTDNYFKSITEWYSKRLLREGPPLEPEHIVEGPSVTNTLFLAINEFTQPGDKVLIMEPVWYAYRKTAEFLGRKVVSTQLYEDRDRNQMRYDINFIDLETKAAECKMMLFCNPHNPTGRIWTEAETKRILSICQKHSVLLFSDEILCDFMAEVTLPRFYSLSNSTYPRLIVANSISKSFNMQSLRGGYAIIRDPSLRQTYSVLLHKLNLHVSELSLWMVEIALSKQGEKWIENATSIVRRNHKHLMKAVKGSLLVVSAWEAAYMIVIDFTGYLKFIERWFAKHKTPKGQPKDMLIFFLAHHNIFGQQVDKNEDIISSVRFAIAVEEEYFNKFVERLMGAVWEVEYEHRNLLSSL